MSDVIPAAQWNDMVRELWRKLNLQVSEVGGEGWQHPWATKATWDIATSRWQATVRPGFVNGLDVTVSDVPLTEAPVIPLTNWRKIGSGADPISAATSDTGDVTLSFEPVPDFFAARGVVAPQSVTGNADTGLLTADAGGSRKLCATDIILHHDRPGLTTVAVGDGLSVGIHSSSQTRDHGYLSAAARFQADAAPDPLQQLAGDWTDSTSDSILVATVYLLSPQDSGGAETPDDTWQPFVKNELFWNLCYTHNTQGLQPNANPLTLQTGLAAGAGDAVIKQMLDQLNTQVQQALDFLANQRIEGRFWTV